MPLRLVEQDGGLHRTRAPGLETAGQVVEGVSAVEDVLDDQDMLVLHVFTGVHQKADVSTGAPVVGGEGDEIDDVLLHHLPRQVGDEDEGALEDSDENQLPLQVPIILGDPAGQFIDSTFDRGGVDQDADQILG